MPLPSLRARSAVVLLTCALVAGVTAPASAAGDRAPAMLEAARTECRGADFVFGDLSIWLPPERPDLLFSNATFQWVPDHLQVLERLGHCLPEAGVLAENKLPEGIFNLIVGDVATVGEAMVAFVLAEAMIDKFGGDSMADVRANLASYRERTAARFAPR